jgi:hypothetical protein
MSTNSGYPGKISSLLSLSFIGICASISAAQADGEALFESHEALQIEIQAPWRKLVKKKDDTRWPATLVMTDRAGETRSVSLTVERRGISRQRVCKFPPIRLRFDKESVKGTVFEGEGALKLVTHCAKGGRWKSYYVLEMLAYRIYNLITDYSFRVRPLLVRYRDTDKDKDPDENFAFVIEDIDQVANRSDLVELEIEKTHPSRLDATTTSRMALFQFLIGNLDWSALVGPENCCHNAKLIGPESGETPFFPIPYDFDSSGFVDAHYAVPPDRLGVRSVTDRYFRGYCTHNRTLPASRQLILDREEEIMALVRDEIRLGERIRNKTLDYLEEFFEVLEDDDEWVDDIVSRCRS